MRGDLERRIERANLADAEFQRPLYLLESGRANDDLIRPRLQLLQHIKALLIGRCRVFISLASVRRGYCRCRDRSPGGIRHSPCELGRTLPKTGDGYQPHQGEGIQKL